MPSSALDGPALVGAAVAGPDDHGGAVGGAGAVDVEAQSGVDVADRAVGVEGPALVGAPVAVPDLHPGAGQGAGRHLQAFAHHLQRLPAAGVLLVGPAVAVPDE